MSAIAGILGRIDDPTNREALDRMLAAMVHRGPDGVGKWNGDRDASGNGCLLAHRRLTTLDASEQPVTTGEKTLVADASIFSHPRALDILRELHCDDAAARVLRLRGAFALALWDEPVRCLLLARDPLGHKPLYFCRNPDASGKWSLAFASEVRALIASKLLGEKLQLDPVAVAAMVWNGFIMSPNTMVQGVSSLLPGECRTFDAAGKEIGSDFSWTMPRESGLTRDESTFRAELREIVRLNLEAHPDAPLGVLLSGGIDSSSIANLAQQQQPAGQKIGTFCMAMEEASLNEGDAARAFAAAIGSEHHEITLTEERFVATLDDAIASLDQPTFDALNQFHICRALREQGVKVAVGGIGGDAIYGGDKTLRQLPKLRNLAMKTAWLPDSVKVAAAKALAAIKQGGQPAGGIGSQQNWAKLPDVVRANGDLLALYQLTYALFIPQFQEQLLATMPTSLHYGLPDPTHAWLSREIANHSPINVAAILETRCFVGERLLRDADTVSSAQSLELRSPLADPRLIEALARLPVDKKFLPVGYKPLLRKYGLEGVDPKLYDRPKQGFVLPFDRWIRKNLGRVMNEVMLDDSACRAAGLRPEAVARLWQAFQQGSPGLYWTRVWAIYVLIRWCQRHNVSALSV
jgi:asparagine synthase (glutamine-hydrolysing)